MDRLGLGEGVREIALTGGEVALVDEQDYERVSSLRWYSSRVGVVVYAYCSLLRTLDGKRPHVSMHRFVLGITDRSIEVDHINRNPLDNRRCNLRLATRLNNCHNRKSPITNTSGYKGVSYRARSKKWRATIRVGGKLVELGLRSTPEAAHALYREAATKFHGEFACLD